MDVQPNLSIIIVNWNSVAFLRRCLASIYTHADGLCLEVVVVDNASYDGSDRIVAEEFPAARFIQSIRNDGFACANNLGFTHARSRNLLFLNPDTEVVGAALVTLLSVLEGTPDAGIVGARLLNSDGSVQTSCIQRFPGMVSQALDAEWLHRAFPTCSLWSLGPLFKNPASAVPVDAVSGACLMIKRRAFEQAGQFTSDYFMYSEDVDLCWKVRRLGWNNYYIGQAEVIHHGGQSTQAKPGRHFSDVMMRESSYKFLTTSRGRAYARAYRLTTAIVAAWRLALLGSALLATLGRFRRAKLIRIFSKWAAVFRWALGIGTRTPGTASGRSQPSATAPDRV